MEPNSEDLPLATKVKISVGTAIICFLILVVAVGFVNYQRQAKAEAAALAKTQLKNVEALKTSFPDYKNTEKFKERAEMSMTKISVEDLPATITAGLNETVSPNPKCASDIAIGYWDVVLGDNEIANNSSTNGWGVLFGSISIPDGAAYGNYKVHYISSETCETEGAHLSYAYVFKITPPCPTSLTVTHSP